MCRNLCAMCTSHILRQLSYSPEPQLPGSICVLVSVNKSACMFLLERDQVWKCLLRIPLPQGYPVFVYASAHANYILKYKKAYFLWGNDKENEILTIIKYVKVVCECSKQMYKGLRTDYSLYKLHIHAPACASNDLPIWCNTRWSWSLMDTGLNIQLWTTK